MRAFSCLTMVLVLMASCGGVARQAASDALEGVDALRQQMVAAHYRHLDEASPILAGVRDNIRATVADADLPAPTMPAEVIAGDPAAYADAAAATLEQAKSGVDWLAIGIGALTVIGTVLSLKFPIAAPVIGGLVRLLSDWNGTTRAERQRQQTRAEGFRALVGVIEHAVQPKEAAPVKRQVAGKVSSAVNDEILAAVRQIGPGDTP